MSQAMISMVPAIRTERPARGVFDRAVAAFSRLRTAWALRHAQRQLEELDARTLADIGIGRGQEEGAARFGRRGLSSWPVQPVAPEAAPFMPSSWTEWR